MKKRSANQLRIIGGQWRGRKLAFPDAEGLRPSGDRLRETLFNWLAPMIPGARCLDLFAGSGALGLEAASRGAGRVVMVERERIVARQLRDNVALLGAGGVVEVVEDDALAYLERVSERFDVVFLDPPFGRGLLGPCCEALESRGLLNEGAHVYLEAERELGEPPLPAGWRLHRSKTSGQVGYHLVIRD